MADAGSNAAEGALHIAVRPLVEYVYRSGSIESGFQTADAMAEGTKIHQKVQQSYSERDLKEVYLKARIGNGELVFEIDGRCDGLLIGEDGSVTIDEIKSTRMDLAKLSEGLPVHWGQACCYAYMYASENGLSEIGVQLTYVSVERDERKRLKRLMAFEELQAMVEGFVRDYAPYARMQLRHAAERGGSITELPFPFASYRSGQRKLAGAVYRTIEEGANLFAKAPTGIGKTISTTFPAIKAMGTGALDRIFYLTARTTTRLAAEEAFARMAAKGLRIHTVTLTAKASICFQEEVRCDKRLCEYADGHYDRINGAVLDLLSEESLMTREVVERYARKHRVCPFELSLDAAYGSDIVICDYNYVFDPRVSLKRLSGEQRKRSALLIDEAHQLVDRSREMFSAELEKLDFLLLQRLLKPLWPEGYAAAKAINDYFIALRKSLDGERERVDKELPEALIGLLERFAGLAEGWLGGRRLRTELSGGGVPGAGGSNSDAAEHGLAADADAGSEMELEALLLDVYFASQAFLRSAKLYDERFLTYTEVRGNDVRLKLYCLDPSHLLRQTGKSYRSQIYFSATLSPGAYYMDMLGALEEDYTVAVPSPFSREQLDVQVVPLSTRYRDRERSKAPIARLLARLAAERAGNYLVFFPSYAYMNECYEALMAELNGGGDLQLVDVQLQLPEMPEEERERYLAAFQAGRDRSLIGFAVMGGIFSEGIDLVGERLTGVVVVGVGLPQIGAERDIIKNYFDDTGKDGYRYAYVYPGMNKVLQAGGRLIRSESDRGVLVLVDDRYLQMEYSRLLPEEWLPYEVVRPF
ncbi:helicase C-terminal domain-containing protein [Paenibacillus sp. NEAU-GSW1]|uniref:helicase C-terminal domain-containing protein n=1 Tax=Paenibacillus sp. NEAU-GSW1 TaxID=2682486 RepID=UPI0012E1AA61|nr:helicase C-terminal domain-containing protein [Paenibacillus sp. NEAU-GSW1]MUT66574.1 ATP-dependent DNA helicase [Paenibacillus sp. NEAU-GSW1]